MSQSIECFSQCECSCHEIARLKRIIADIDVENPDAVNVMIKAMQEQKELIATLRKERDELIGACKELMEVMPLVEESVEITTHHASGGSATMGPNMTRRFIQAAFKINSVLAKVSGGGNQ